MYQKAAILTFILLVVFTNSAQSRRRFNGPEHSLLGDSVRIRLTDSTVSGSNFNARMREIDYSLSFGQLVAFAGDFYGPSEEDEVICLGETFDDRVDRARAAFETWYLSDDEEYVEFVEELIDEQSDIVTSYHEAGYSTHFAYESIGLGPEELARTGDLLNWNFDHFNTLNGIQECNQLAFEAFHYYAQTLAAAADDDDDLSVAYSAEAFANHYYTDAFAGGHIRTARDVTIYHCPEDSFDVSTGLMVNMNHNQDNYNGLVVNFMGEEMRLFGDGQLLDHPENEELIVSAVQDRVDEIYDAFISRTATEIDVPYPIAEDDGSRLQYCPKFIANEDGDEILTSRNTVPDSDNSCDLVATDDDDCPRVPPEMWFDVDCPDDADDEDDCVMSWHAVRQSFDRSDRATDIILGSDVALQAIASDAELSIIYLSVLSSRTCLAGSSCCEARQLLFEEAMDSSNRQQNTILNIPITSIDVWTSSRQSCSVDDILDPIADRATTRCLHENGVLTTESGDFIDQNEDLCSGYGDNDDDDGDDDDDDDDGDDDDDSGSGYIAVSFSLLVFVALFKLFV